MTFKEIVKDIAEGVEGGVAAIILGYDGIAIEEYTKDQPDNLDVQLLAVEYATLLKEVKRTVDTLKTGEMEEVSVTTGHSHIVIRAINDDFFIVLVLQEGGNYGKGRYLLKRHVPALRSQLS